MANDQIHSEIEAAYCLPPPAAIKKLSQLDVECKKIVDELEAPASPFPTNPVGIYLTLHRFDRNVKLLQIIEAIRDHASRNGELPKELSGLDLHCPNDPLTGKPFEYRISNTQAVLNTPEIPGLDQKRHQQGKTYRLKIASGQ